MNSPAEKPTKRPVIKAKRKTAQADQPEAPDEGTAEPAITIPVSVWEKLQQLAEVGIERRNRDAVSNAYVQALRRR